MSDAGSYDENIEVQETTSYNSGSGGGGEDNGGYSGGDSYSVSSIGSSHHNHHYTTHYTTYHHHSRGGYYYDEERSSGPVIGGWADCKMVIRIFCLVIICLGLYVFISSSYAEFTTPKPTLRLPKSTPPPPTPKVWSGDFSGVYRAKNEGAWAKDSATKNPTAICKEMAALETKLTITKVNSGDNGTATSTFIVQKEQLDDGSFWREQPRRFNFTSGVRFPQKSTQKGIKSLELSSSSSAFDNSTVWWEEVPTTITVETFADADRGGKKGIWREVQHGSSEVKIKRIFFDDEMTAIYQSRSKDLPERWDIYVVKYERK